MSPARLTVATAQFAVSPSPMANARQMMTLLTRAADAGAQVVHFPEGALSGYPGHQVETWQGYDWSALAAAADQIAEACRKAGLWAVFGSAQPIKGKELPSNAVFVIGPDGRARGRYDKRCCSLREGGFFTPGEVPLAVDIEGLRCGVLLCLEWAFPELWRAYADAGVELVFLSAYAAGLQGRHLHSDVIPPTLQGHAFTNSLFISVSNAGNPAQAFASHWVKRSGRRGSACRRDRRGLTINAIVDDPEKDDLYRRIRAFRAETSSRLEEFRQKPDLL